MKLDKKQQERIEGWLHDCFKPCKILDLTVTNTGINYKVEINFTTEKYGNSFDETLEKRREIYNHYSNCITVGVEENKITTTAEIANKFNRSSYKKDSDNLYSFDFTHFKKLVTALLANQPEEDVKDFCDNIKGEIIINYDEFYERILNGLMDYYKSDEYLTKLAKYEKMSQPTMETASFEYSLRDYDTYNLPDKYTNWYDFADGEDGLFEDALKDSLVELSYNSELSEAIKEINSEFKDMDNLTTPGELLKVTKVNTEYVNSQVFRLNISFSDKISYDQACVIHDILVDYFELYTKVYYYGDRVYKAQYTIGWNIY